MDTWFKHYDTKHRPNLNLNSSAEKRGLLYNIYNRADGYSLIFEELFNIRSGNFKIIETGTVRKPNNWKDGNSGFIFSELVEMVGGYVRSVDIDKNAVDSANSYINRKNFEAYHSDSVEWLKSQNNLHSVDLFYLDSYDVKWNNDEASAIHHLKEFLAIESYLNNCVVAIDDNAFLKNGTRTGKGRLIYEYLSAKGIKPIYDKYQIIYRF